MCLDSQAFVLREGRRGTQEYHSQRSRGGHNTESVQRDRRLGARAKKASHRRCLELRVNTGFSQHFGRGVGTQDR
jgi:hypothetical protein